MNNEFGTQLSTSYGYKSDDIKAIKEKFGNKYRQDKEFTVEQTRVSEDKAGADYKIVYKDSGKAVYVDVKRRFGSECKKYARHGAIEVALETLSVCPDAENKKVYGWLVDTKKITDYILYAFDKDVCDECYLFPYALLRKAFYNNYGTWNALYDKKRENNERKDGTKYQSEALFVPVNKVIDAVRDAFTSSGL